jgi:hypothetical protein
MAGACGLRARVESEHGGGEPTREIQCTGELLRHPGPQAAFSIRAAPLLNRGSDPDPGAICRCKDAAWRRRGGSRDAPYAGQVLPFKGLAASGSLTSASNPVARLLHCRPSSEWLTPSGATSSCPTHEEKQAQRYFTVARTSFPNARQSARFKLSLSGKDRIIAKASLSSRSLVILPANTLPGTFPAPHNLAS